MVRTLQRLIDPLYALCLLLLPYGAAQGYEALATAHVVAMPPMTYPDYLQTVTDPSFGTPFTRVTDPGQEMLPGVACELAYCTHRYSSSQAWNADQSLRSIVNGCSGVCFLDGSTYAPLFHRTIPNECEWHPLDPALMICVSGDEIYTWNPQSDVRTAVYTFDGYQNLQFGPYKGNPSKDGTRLVVRATNQDGTLVAFAYDMSTLRKYPDIDLTDLSGRNGNCTISPSGRYVFCANETFDGTDIAYVFTVDGVQLQHWTEHHRPGHGDMTIDTDGSDVYVGISKANPDKYHIIKVPLLILRLMATASMRRPEASTVPAGSLSPTAAPTLKSPDTRMWHRSIRRSSRYGSTAAAKCGG
jgi:hypothetical protein